MLADVLSCTVLTLFFVKRAGRMRHTVFTLCKNLQSVALQQSHRSFNRS